MVIRRKIIFMTLFFVVSILIEKTKCCVCPSQAKRPIDFLTNDNFELEDVIIEGVNMGKPIIFENKLLILKKTYPVLKSLASMEDKCPSGFELLNENDINTMAANPSINYDKLIQVGVLAGQTLYSNTKSYPTKTDGSDGQSWEYKSMILSESTTKTITLTSKNTYFEKNGVVICKQKTSISVSTGSYDLKLGKTYTLSVNEKNIKSVIWSINETTTNTKTFTLNTKSLLFDNNNCKVLLIWALNAANQEGYTCSILFFVDYFGSNGSTDPISNMNTEFSIERTENLVQTTTSIYFNSPDVVTSPTNDGGAWVGFTDSTTKEINVLKIDSSLKTTSKYQVEKNSQILDIVTTPFGFAIYARSTEDQNYSYLAGYFNDGKNKFKRTIMNNGLNPTTANDQISFFDKDKKNIVWANEYA